MIDVQEITKRYGGTLAVDRLSFSARAGTVTGFPGAERRRQVHLPACCWGWTARTADARWWPAAPTRRRGLRCTRWGRCSTRRRSCRAGAPARLSDPVVVRGVLGLTAVLVLTGLLGLAVGALLRSTSAAVIVLTVVLFLLPVLVGLLPAAVSDRVGPWLPGSAGTAVLLLRPQDGYLSPGAGLALAVVWAAATLVLATLTLRRRDA